MTQPTAEELGAKIRALAGTRKIVLHIGCGAAKDAASIPPAFRDAKKWFVLRLDRDAKTKPNIIADARHLPMLPDACVEAVWVEMLEHLAAADVPAALREFYRVLRMGGEIVIETPDLQTVASYIAQGNLAEPVAGDRAPHDLLYGASQPQLTGFTYTTLTQQLRKAGFTTITMTRRRITLLAHARKLAKSHNARRERPVIERAADFNAREVAVASAANLDKLPHPGARWKGKATDELDVPPAKI